MFLFSMYLPTAKASWTPVLKTETFTFLGDTQDGYVLEIDENYTIAHDALIGNESDSIKNWFRVGQWDFIDVDYRIFRGFVVFDTAYIPDEATLLNATLQLYNKSYSSSVYFNITLQNGQPTYPHTPLELEDYYCGHYSGNGGSLNTSALTEGYNNISLNDNALSWINVTGKTKFCLRSSRDINSIPPLDAEIEEVLFYSGDESSGAYVPKLTVSYQYYAEEEPPSSSGGDTGEPTTVIDIPEINIPEFHIPIWGYYLILGSIVIVLFASILSKPPRSRHGPNGVKLKKTTKRYPKRNKKGRFT